VITWKSVPVVTYKSVPVVTKTKVCTPAPAPAPTIAITSAYTQLPSFFLTGTANLPVSTQVLDFRYYINGVYVQEPDPSGWYGGVVHTDSGSVTPGAGLQVVSTPGVNDGRNISPGSYTATVQVIGAAGNVLSTSAPLAITVPAPAPTPTPTPTPAPVLASISVGPYTFEYANDCLNGTVPGPVPGVNGCINAVGMVEGYQVVMD
jgi:hypothetical protein